MKKLLIVLMVLVVVLGQLVVAVTPDNNSKALAFTKNNGQWDDQVLFRANAGGATMWFTKEGITYQFIRSINKSGGAVPVLGAAQGNLIPGLDSRFRGSDMKPDSFEQLVLKASFVGANPNPEVVGEGLMEYKCNYFLGNDPAKWHTDVPNYSAIVFKDIYPGIDLKYSSDGNGQVAYEFVVAPGADVAQIKISYEDAEETSLDADGRLIVRTKWGDMIAALKSPTNGALSGTGSFSLLSGKTIGFEADRSNGQAPGTLPVGLSYSTYLGGNSWDWGYGLAVDGSGNAYVTGWTWSSNFPTQNPYQTWQGPDVDRDVFVTKLSSSGNSLIYSTYLGGDGRDWGYGIEVDGSSNAYVTGWTASSNFPTQNPYQTDQGERDIFVTKLSSAGNSLIYSTYLGGSDRDGEFGVGIAVDGNHNAYVMGTD